MRVREFAQSFAVFNLQNKAVFSGLFCRGFHRKNCDRQSQRSHSDLRVRISGTRRLRGAFPHFDPVRPPSSVRRVLLSPPRHRTAGVLRGWMASRSHTVRGAGSRAWLAELRTQALWCRAFVCHKAHSRTYPQDTLTLYYSLLTWVN